MEHLFEAIIRKLLSGELTQKQALTSLYRYENEQRAYFEAEIKKLKDATP
jgi:hypothetical protein